MINWTTPYNSTEWIKLRDEHLNNQPYCVKCSTTLRLQVDHIIPHNNRIDLFLDHNNLQTLCISHHAEKTNQLRFLRDYKVKDYSINIKLGQHRGISLNQVKYLKEQASQYMRHANSYDFYVIETSLNFSTAQNLINLLCEFFKRVNFMSFNIFISDGDKFNIRQFFKDSVLN
ncbi:HNH endonuclease [Mycoplasma miroungigenitalium]|uniref:HNH endonuclease n=1 Tax=Mycoplasma miroungigenitalium TaxID=754515 RepID=UPI001BB1CE2C|nr:HNH endonuclease signature motif containing protein [Mycoplasma miroungigenitalium]